MIKRALIALLCGMMTALSACSGGGKQELVVGVMPDFDSIPFIVAKQKGYMPENVRLDIYKSPVDRDSALFSGGMDGTISDVLAAALANQGGFEVVITSKTDGCYGLLTHEKLDAKELEGKQIGLSMNTIIEYAVDCIIEKSGGNPELVEKVAVPKIPSRLELLNNGQIAAIGIPEPYVTAAVDAGAHLVSTSSALNINPGVMLFQKKAVDGKKAEIKAFYEAYNKAVDYINSTDKAEFMPAVIDELGLPESAMKAQLPKYSHADVPGKLDVYDAVSWLLRKELIEREYSYGDLVDDGMLP